MHVEKMQTADFPKNNGVINIANRRLQKRCMSSPFIYTPAEEI